MSRDLTARSVRKYVVGTLLAVLSCLLLVGIVRVPVFEIATAPPREISIPTEDFGDIRVRAPGREPKAFAILLSDSDGLTPALERTADLLVAAGVAVVPLSTHSVVAGLAKSNDGACHYVFGDFEDISRDAQRALGVEHYKWPVLAGVGEGGTLAYLAMTQAPVNTTAGAISIGFSPSFVSKLPICPGAPSNPKPAGEGYTYRPFAKLPGRWLAYFDEKPDAERAAFFKASPLSKSKVLPWLGGTKGELIVNAVLTIGQPVQGELSDLPLVELPTASPPRALAVFYSGDGGWRDIDKSIADLLNQKGVAVIGVDSLRYFWREKSPKEIARDLDRIVAAYQARWGAKKVALLGYSMGAGVLPFAWGDLAKTTQDNTVLIGLLGLSPQSSFQVSVSSFLGLSSPKDVDVLPALKSLPATRVMCFYGVDELAAGDTACGASELAGATRVERPGGHHFDGDYDAVAKLIVERL